MQNGKSSLQGGFYVIWQSTHVKIFNHCKKYNIKNLYLAWQKLNKVTTLSDQIDYVLKNIMSTKI